MSYKKIVVRKKTTIWDEAVAIVEVPLPESVSEGEVLIKVYYTGIEASDIIQNAGGYGPLATAEPEEVATGAVQIGDTGCEGVGVIMKIGEGVSLQVGQAVFWSAFGTSFREFTVLNAADCMVCPSPDPMWTAIPVSGLTAVGGLELVGRLAPGENVLVTAASGGTGQFAVQWAKAKGCRVAGTCGNAEKAELLKSIGCDVIINYKTDDVNAVLKREFPQGVDVVYEAVGGSLLKTSFDNLAMFGRLVIIGSVGEDYEKLTAPTPVPFTSSQLMFKSVSVAAFFLGCARVHPRFPEIAKQLIQYIADGTIQVKLDPGCQKFVGIEGVTLAQRQMRSGDSVGKVYCKINTEDSKI